MRSLSFKLQDSLLSIGWLLVLLSFALFCLPSALPPTGVEFGFFLIHFLVAVSYWFYVFFSSKEAVHRIHYTFIRLTLFLISAFALNRNMDVFSESPAWLSVLLVVVCLNYLASAFFADMPLWARRVHLFIMGLGFFLFLYYALYLLPLYLLSIVGLVAFGFSIHSFIPLLFCVYTIVFVRRSACPGHWGWLSFSGGLAAALTVVVVFTLYWNSGVREMNRVYQASFSSPSELPGWVQVAQVVKDNSREEEVLKSGLIYRDIDPAENLFWRMPGFNPIEEMSVHDPLVLLAGLFSPRLQMPEEERLEVLRRQYRIRHESEERLWSGDHLTTEQVSTQVRVWPDLHLAYTELLMTVFNHHSEFSREEAIYTFHLPEGAVVTSLSLWIDGAESKGILTTREKATEAYRTIVGVESRDPSVVHWQEGNTVTVRVFPVMGGGSRRFKLGITSPLRQQDGQLVYDNPWFYGPDASSAQESVTVEMENAPRSFIRQASFAAPGNNRFTRQGKYQPRWSLRFREQGLRPHVFTFNGQGYYLKPYRPNLQPVVTDEVYLDINSSWTREDFDSVCAAAAGRRVRVWKEGWVNVDASNRQEIFDQLKRSSFSLFPFHHLPDPDRALVVSRSGVATPTLDELKGSAWMEGLKQLAASGTRIRVFHLDSELSPYLRSMKEFRMLQYMEGDARLLKMLLEKNEFVQDRESDEEVIVHSAGIAIARAPGNHPSTAPDHLMRLFAYNHILQKSGSRGLAGSPEDPALVQEAREAYVVSPVSSLVVLETQKDYDRFNIHDQGASLKNASLNSKGAVPEPQEWALILLVAVVLGFLWFKLKI